MFICMWSHPCVCLSVLCLCVVCVSAYVLSFCRVRSAPLNQPPGYQVELVVQLLWVSGEPPQPITSLAVNSAYGL